MYGMYFLTLLGHCVVVLVESVEHCVDGGRLVAVAVPENKTQSNTKYKIP